MPIIPLGVPSQWGWDTSTGELLMRLQQAPPEDEPDPAAYQPTKEAVVRFTPSGVNIRDIVG